MNIPQDPSEWACIHCENHSLLNAIRRTILSDIECFAYDEIELLLNESSVCDAELEHRISMLPVKHGKEERIEVNIINIEDSIKIIKSEEIPGNAFKSIPLCKLPSEKQIEFCAKIKKGSASLHSKWAVVSAAFFENDSTLKFETIGNISANYIKNQAFLKLRKDFVEVARQKTINITMPKHRRHTIGNLLRETIIKSNKDIICGYHLTDDGIEMYMPTAFDSYGRYIDLKQLIVKACYDVLEMINDAVDS